ncbi:MAG: class I tRNA ligase family protein [Verrucomicrobiota bacterium]
MPERFFLTTAIDYVNGPPHLGHAYEKVVADIQARYQRSLGKDVHFLTGVDQHGQKMKQTADQQGTTPRKLAERMTPHFLHLLELLEVSNDRFAVTTDAGHIAAVQALQQRLFDAGDIYFAEYEGYYSTRAEQYVTEKDKVDGEWPELFGEVVELTEANYFFRTSKYQAWLVEHLQANPGFIFPEFRANEVLAALKEPLNDMCISRPKSRLDWGIELPFDRDYVTYVWFDALLNYYTFSGKEGPDGEKRWPADEHHIGKDIMVPAHAVYWPTMLKAMDLPLPGRLCVHGFWSVNGAKMSKTTGNFIEPGEYVAKYGADALRYFLARECVFGQDADFSEEKFRQRYSSDLAKGLGNLVQRSLSMLHRYRDGVVPAYAADAVTEAEAELRHDAVLDAYRAAMDALNHRGALETVWAFIQSADQYIEQTQPFKLAKDAAQAGRLDVILAHLVETVRRLAVLVEPVLPATAGKIRRTLNLPATTGGASLTEAAFGTTLAGQATLKPTPLFPGLEQLETQPPTPN